MLILTSVAGRAVCLAAFESQPWNSAVGQRLDPAVIDLL